MAKNAIVLSNKAAQQYSASRPLHYILADGTQAGITAALKQAGAGSQLLHGLMPDGASDVANWKTAPITGGNRWTLYNGKAALSTAITGWAWVETPHMLALLTEGASNLLDSSCGFAGEVLVAHDSTLGESATFGNADGRTMYGLLQSIPVPLDTTTSFVGLTSPQSVAFIGAEATRRLLTGYGFPANTFSAALMVPSGYGTGDWTARETPFRINASFRVGYPAWLLNCKEGAHYSSLTVDGAATRRVGNSATVSTVCFTGRRKDGATADTIYFRRTVATYADWTAFLQAIWDDAVNLTYWEQNSSA